MSLKLTTLRRCPVCNEAGARYIDAASDLLYGSPGTWSFDRCLSCRTVFLNPRPSTEHAVDLHPDDYYTHTPKRPPVLSRTCLSDAVLAHFGYPSRGGRSHPILFRMLTDRRRSECTAGLYPLLPEWRPGGRVLDVGCGDGSALAALRSLGWDVAGVEIDPAARSAATSILGIPIHTTIAEAVGHCGLFDVVLLSHVIEHVPSPFVLLEAAVSALAPNGDLLALTPNSEALGLRLYGRNWYALQPPQHLVLLSRQGAKLLCAGIRGTDTVETRTTPRASRKLIRRSAELRRSGSLRDRTSQPDPLAAALAYLETVLCAVSNSGEEIVIKMRRHSPGNPQ